MADVATPIDRYLARQQSATAVDRFSARENAVDDRWYAERLPTTAPAPGEQYAFRVDLDQCSGCKSCVAACHSLNGLDDGESWRSVGLLVGTRATDRQRQHVPSGCHHCVEPACLAGCPTNAYEKDPFTGIVRHLDDQCFGCGYCELTCPYEVPKMNARLGVVRKCDMCTDRLAVGEAPACVQACPTSAITITVVDTATVVADATGPLVPGAPDSALTVPTTQYVSREPLPDSAVAADHHALHLSAGHPPLVFMLVLTQISVGAFLAGALAGPLTTGPGPAEVRATATAVGVVALGGAFAHLGRPWVAWRAVLGVAHSWFSREVVAFSLYLGAALANVGAAAFDLGAGLIAVTAGLAVVFGLAGVACSAQIYIVTRRTWWARRFVATKFVGTAIHGGAATFSLTWLALGASLGPVPLVAAIGAGVGAAKLADEASVGRGRGVTPGDDLDRTARLLRHTARTSTQVRAVLGVVGVVALGALAAITSAQATVNATTISVALVAMVAIVGGELVERYQFFIASVAPRMPGRFRS